MLKYTNRHIYTHTYKYTYIHGGEGTALCYSRMLTYKCRRNDRNRKITI